jgi:hypothetical protein
MYEQNRKRKEDSKVDGRAVLPTSSKTKNNI